MSANNQTLIKEHKGKFCVFTNVNAESWGWDEEKDVPAPNKLSIKNCDGVFDTKDEAYSAALELDRKSVDGFGSEYGVQFNRLCKREELLKEINNLIAEEMLICNTEHQPTSRLTSLAVKIKNLK